MMSLTSNMTSLALLLTPYYDVTNLYYDVTNTSTNTLL